MLHKLTMTLIPMLAAGIIAGCSMPTLAGPPRTGKDQSPQDSPQTSDNPGEQASKPAPDGGGNAPTGERAPGSPAGAPSKPADASAADYLVVSWYEIGSNPSNNLYQLSPQLRDKGWKSYLFEPPFPGQTSMYDQVTRFGPDEIVFHRPFGQPPSSNHMNFGAYVLAKKNPSLAKVTDIFAFVDAFSEFYRRAGRKPMTFYFGYVIAADEPFKGKTRDEKKAVVKESLSPVKALRDKIADSRNPNPIRIALDTYADQDPSKPGWDDFVIVKEVCTEWGFPLDAEPWPSRKSPLVTDAGTRFIVVENLIKHAENGNWAAPRNSISGPHRILPYLSAPPADDKRSAKTRAVDSLRRDGAVAWQGWDLTTSAAELKRLAAAGK